VGPLEAAGEALTAARRTISRTLLVLAAACAVWGVWLSVFGGFTTTIFGILVKSNAPRRPLLLSLVLLAARTLVVHHEAIAAFVKSPTPFARRWIADGWRWASRVWSIGVIQDGLAAAFVLALLVAGIVDGSKAAGGSDSYGYLSEAGLWRAGHLAVPQPWAEGVPWPNALKTFAPLGYIPSPPRPTLTIAGYRPAHDPWSIVPAYSAGFPMLMAAASLTGNTCAPFWVVPIGGCLLVLSTYLLGRRLGSRDVGLLAALLVAASPPFLLFHLVLMSDVPVAGALTLACWCILGSSVRSAIGAAALLAIAILIRPNLVVVLPALALLLLIRIRREGDARRRHVLRALVALSGAGLGVLGTMTIYWVVYGSPFESGYGPTSEYFGIDHILPNTRNYTTWFVETQTAVPFLGLIALFAPVAWLWRDITQRWVIPIFGLFVATVLAEFMYYLVFGNSSYLRFLLPCYPFVMLGLSSAALSMARLVGRVGPLLAAVALVLLAIVTFRTAVTKWYAFEQWNTEAKFIDVAEHVRNATPENSVVLAQTHSGSIRYFGGRMTVRWDLLSSDWLDRAIAWMSERGVRTYALLDDFEMKEMREHFAGETLVSTLDDPPVFRFGNKLFYDFGRPRDTPVETFEIPVVDLPRRCVGPAPAPVIIWKK